ncbi:RBBP9/YdeN family alpha/beta hydrolase [Denitratisoma oestradiolicum]|uniref:Alpha/beta hydrolase n=1 Tax=Denitratisoma oestradiolicum TaxID=311182 RepID=A0A6S6Y5Z1_9PROT|nr:alpha/beta hydrolase [Denitratisoma oestradiolicum]TWO80777.1 alpha/beta hydrolase [Denitratisoma oestradiolicum]CAB1370910.1 Alpha/beta hydrolase [Denitratisoma oestradiolicum]
MLFTLIVPGLHGSGPDHWQTWWQRQDPTASRVEQGDWETPDLHQWASKVGQAIDQSRAPVWIVAHSFGCLAARVATEARPERVAGLLLVAPADPDRFGISDLVPRNRLSCPSILVASSNDPWMRLMRAAYWAKRWNSRLVSAGNAGHINAESGFGPWPQGQDLFRQLVHAQGGLPFGELNDASATDATC